MNTSFNLETTSPVLFDNFVMCAVPMSFWERYVAWLKRCTPSWIKRSIKKFIK